MITWSDAFLWGAPGLLALIGVAWLAWAMLWDRARGRLRCPKCWYDMAGAADLACPECGRTSKRPAHLKRTRRRWRHALAAMLLLLAVYPLHITILAQRISWPKALPTTVLIHVAPLGDEAWVKQPHGVGAFAGLQDPRTEIAFRNVLDPKPADPFLDEVLLRARERRLSIQQWRWLLARIHRVRPDLLRFEQALRTRPVWSRDSEVITRIQTIPLSDLLGLDQDDCIFFTRLVGSDHPGSDEYFQNLGPPGDGETGQIELTIGLSDDAYESMSKGARLERFRWTSDQTIWRGVVREFDIVDRASEILPPVASTQIEEELTNRFNLVQEPCGDLGLMYNNNQINADPDIAVGIDILIYRADELVATGVFALETMRGWTSVNYYGPPPRVRLVWVDRVHILHGDDAPWRIEYRGNPGVALTAQSSKPPRVTGIDAYFDTDYPTTYWNGRVTFPSERREHAWDLSEEGMFYGRNRIVKEHELTE